MTHRFAPVLAPVLAVAALAGCKPGSGEPKVTQAWVRLAAVPGQPAAGYFTVTGGRHDTRIVQVESALAARIEMHESMRGTGGMSAMMPLAEAAVPARAEARFAPGGRHLMIHGLDKAIVPGTALPLRFGFADGRTTEAEAKTVAAGDDAPY